MLISSEDVIQARTKLVRLSEKHFTSAYNTQLFKDIKKLIMEYQPADCVSLVSQFPQYENSMQFLLEVQNQIATTVELDSYIIQLKEAWAKNELQAQYKKKLPEIIESVNVEKALIDYEENLRRIRNEVKRIEVLSTDEIISDAEKKATVRKDNQEPDLVSYSMEKVRDYVHLFRGQVNVVAARSGLGKTAFGLSCIRDQLKSGINTVFFCCESNAHELYQRLACIFSTSSYINMIRGFPYGGEKAFRDALGFFRNHDKNLKIFGRDNYEHSVENIDYQLWNLAQKTRLDKVYIDYFQAMKINYNGYKKQHQEYEMIMEGVANLAVKYNCAITLFCQLNRVEGEDGIPRVHNLRGSSAIENSAHIVSFLFQDKEIRKDADLRVKPTNFYSDKTRLISPFNLSLAYDSYCGAFWDTMEPVPFPWQKRIGYGRY